MTDEERDAIAMAQAKMAVLAKQMPPPLSWTAQGRASASPWKPFGHPAWCVETTFEGDPLRVSLREDGFLLGVVSHDGEPMAASAGTRYGPDRHDPRDPHAVVRETLLNLQRRARDMDRQAGEFAEALGISLDGEP